MVRLQGMPLLIWLFTLPAMLMMLLFALARANEDLRRVEAYYGPHVTRRPRGIGIT